MPRAIIGAVACRHAGKRRAVPVDVFDRHSADSGISGPVRIAGTLARRGPMIRVCAVDASLINAASAPGRFCAGIYLLMDCQFGAPPLTLGR